MTNLLLSLAARAARLLPAPIKRALYRLGPITALIRGSLNRAAPQGLTEVIVAAGRLEGLTLLVDMQSEKDYWLGTYEPELQNALSEMVEPGIVAYDVGANVGYISLLLGRLVGSRGQVFCFEPLAGNQTRLQRNLSLNQGLSQFHVIPLAVSDRTGEVQFLVHDSDDMGKVIGSAGRQTNYEHTISVKSTSLDDFIFQQGYPPPQMIKLDIEGGEVLALPGMMRLLTEYRPVLLIELHGKESGQAAWKLLTEIGYTVHRMQADYPQVTDPAAFDWKAYIVGRPGV